MQRIEHTYATHEEWLKLREGKITSTSMSAILGVSKYKTKFELWHEVQSGIQKEFEETERTVWGNRLEAVIAEGIAEDNAWEVEPFKTFFEIPELRTGSSFDYKILKNDKRPDQKGILEIKNVDGLIFSREWTVEEGEIVEAPPHIEVQVQHQLFLSGYDYAIIGVFVGGNKPYTILREPDQELFTLFQDEITKFNHSIDHNIEPTPDWARDAEFIRLIYNSVAPGKVFEVAQDQDVVNAATEYLLAGRDKKHAQERQDAAKAFMLTRIGDCEKGAHEEFSISAGYVGPAQVSYLREGYRNFRITPKKSLKERLGL